MPPEQRGNSVTPQQQIAAIAGMQVEIRHLANSIAELSEDVRSLQEKLGETQHLMDRGRGAWSTLVVIGTAAAAVLTAATWVFEHFGKFGGKL